MFFVNNSGHIFELPSFSEKPIGYEYEENPLKQYDYIEPPKKSSSLLIS